MQTEQLFCISGQATFCNIGHPLLTTVVVDKDCKREKKKNTITTVRKLASARHVIYDYDHLID